MPDDIVDAGQTTCYSARSAVSGRTLAARRAGSRDAARRLTPMVTACPFRPPSDLTPRCSAPPGRASSRRITTSVMR